LRRRGYRILARNLRLGDDEADLVALAPDRRTVVIVEVKTRVAGPTPPESSVGPRKRRRLLRLARRLAQRAPYTDRPLRIDVVAIETAPSGRWTVRHHVDAIAAGR
jgi:putative endonuclease